MQQLQIACFHLVSVRYEVWGCQVVDLENAADSEEAADLDRLLQCIQAELDTGRSFEHVQVIAAPACCTQQAQVCSALSPQPFP